ncbi:MAG: PhzF family phenazine biosynthesis protein, partial [Terriglobales bacterium]
DPELGLRHSPEDVARVTGLKIDEIADDVPIQTVSTGLAFTIVPVRTLASMRALHPDLKAASQYLEGSQGKFFYFVSRETEDKSARLHARMIFYNGDDPATGSAAGCTAAWMVAHGVVKPEERALIEQGIETRRPSQIFVRAGRDGDRIVNVRVGGNSVEVIRGEVFL